MSLKKTTVSSLVFVLVTAISLAHTHISFAALNQDLSSRQRVGPKEAGDALRGAFSARGQSPQDAYITKAITDVGQKCPGQFQTFMGDAAKQFRKCELETKNVCKKGLGLSVNDCGRLIIENCSGPVENFLEKSCTDSESIKPDVKKAESNAPSCGKAFLQGLKSEKEKPKLKPSPFSITRGVPVDSDSAQSLVSATETLKNNESTTIEGKFTDGRSFALGIIKKPDGSLAYTTDGLTYHDSPKDVLRPGLFTKVGDRWKKAKDGFFGLFGVGKYTGKDTKDQNSQKKGQQILDSAMAAIDSLKRSIKDPDKTEKTGKEAIDRFHGGADNLLNGQYSDVILDEIKVSTGCGLPFIKKILSGEIVDAIIDKGALIRKLQTFPAQSVITMAKEVRAANFANAARLYIEERENKTPAQITELLKDGKLPELDLATSIKGVGQEFAKGALLNSYEETYQRYLLAKKLAK